MTPAERAALRELEAKATPGPWSFDVDQCDIYQPLVDRGKKVFSVHSYRPDDVDFIAAARAAILPLLDDCDRLERERDEARALLRSVIPYFSPADSWEYVGPALDAVARWDAETK